MKELVGTGVEPIDLNLMQVCFRAFIVFFAALAIVRLANRRFLGKLSPLDVILGFVLASMLARAINGSGPLLASIAAGFLVVLLHRGMAALSFRSRFVGRLVKGRPDILVQDGKIQESALVAHNITRNDLLEAVRIAGGIGELSEITTATLERDGSISVIKAKR